MPLNTYFPRHPKDPKVNSFRDISWTDELRAEEILERIKTYSTYGTPEEFWEKVLFLARIVENLQGNSYRYYKYMYRADEEKAKYAKIEHEDHLLKEEMTFEKRKNELLELQVANLESELRLLKQICEPS